MRPQEAREAQLETAYQNPHVKSPTVPRSPLSQHKTCFGLQIAIASGNLRGLANAYQCRSSRSKASAKGQAQANTSSVSSFLTGTRRGSLRDRQAVS